HGVWIRNGRITRDPRLSPLPMSGVFLWQQDTWRILALFNKASESAITDRKNQLLGGQTWFWRSTGCRTIDHIDAHLHQFFEKVREFDLEGICGELYT